MSTKRAGNSAPKATPKKATRSAKPAAAAKPAAKPQKRPGRPAGAPNRDYPEGNVSVTRCINHSCLSTEKVAVQAPQRVPTNTTGPDGKPCNLVINRRVKCTQCGQHRVDKEFHLVTE